MAAPVALWEVPEVFRNRDLIWFLDNQGAEAGLIKGYSGEEDSAAMIGITHIHLAHLNARVWFDHVPSEVNPSDGLSRDGLLDKWTQEQDWDLFEVTLPDISGLVGLPIDELLRHFSEDLSRVPSPDIREAPVEWKIPKVSPDELAADVARDANMLHAPSLHKFLGSGPPVSLDSKSRWRYVSPSGPVPWELIRFFRSTARELDPTRVLSGAPSPPSGDSPGVGRGLTRTFIRP